MLNRIGNSLSAQFTPLRTGVLYAPARRTFLQSNPVQVEVFARDFDLTDAIQERVDKKIGKVVGKLGQDAISAHVVLRLHKQHMNGNLTLSCSGLLCSTIPVKSPECVMTPFKSLA